MKHQKDPSRKIRVILRVVLIALFAVFSLAVLQPKAEAVPICKHLNSTWQTTRVPTCTQTGLKQKICTKCGAVVQTQTISAYGHDYYVERQNATCTTDGWIRTKCARCNLVSNYTTLSALGHSLTSTWTTSKSPTCVTAGTEYQKCQRCKKNVTRSIDPLGHQLSWVTTTPATCTSRGTESQKCSRCGTVVSTRSIPMKKHTNPDGYVIEVPATCTSDGKKVLRCKDCNTILDTLVIPKYGHDCYVQRQNATCTTDGWEETICTRCGCTVASTVRPALGHNPSDWITTTEATCSDYGVQSQTCTRCNAVIDTRTLPMKKHVLAPATCTTPETCINCNTTFGSPAPHKFLEPTCTYPGACLYCGCPSGEAPLTHEYNAFGVCIHCRTQSPAPGYNGNNEMIYVDTLNEVLELYGGTNSIENSPLRAIIESGQITGFYLEDNLTDYRVDWLNNGLSSILLTDSVMDYRPQFINSVTNSDTGNEYVTYYMITPKEHSYNENDDTEWNNSMYEWNITICECHSYPHQNGITVSFEVNNGFTISIGSDGYVLFTPDVCEPLRPELAAVSTNPDNQFSYLTAHYSYQDIDKNVAVDALFDTGSAIVSLAAKDYVGAATSAVNAMREMGDSFIEKNETEKVVFKHKETNNYNMNSYTNGTSFFAATASEGKELRYVGDKLEYNIVCETNDYNGIETFIYLPRMSEDSK